MMSYVKGRQLAFVFSSGSLGDLNLGAFGRGVPGGSSEGTSSKSSAQCKDAPSGAFGGFPDVEDPQASGNRQAREVLSKDSPACRHHITAVHSA